MRQTQPNNSRSGNLSGVGLAILANICWGTMPMYFKAVSNVPSVEVMLHRVVWCALLLWAWLVLSGSLGIVWPILRSPQTAAILGCTGLLLVVQWWMYIHAVNSGQLLQSSFGYFLAPLMNVVFGVLFLRDRLRAGQWLAVALAMAGTLNLCRLIDQFPWMGVTIGVNFALYAVLRKRVDVSALVGLTVETTVMLPFSLVLLLVLQTGGQAHFGAAWNSSLVLALSGAVTAAPLLAYVGAARRLSLATLGVFQYLSPTFQFGLAIYMYGEFASGPFFTSFLLIWIAVVLYVIESLWQTLRSRRAAQWRRVGPTLAWVNAAEATEIRQPCKMLAGSISSCGRAMMEGEES